MASGKTVDMIMFSRQAGYRRIFMEEAFTPQERDRSLRGKARRKARKAKNKMVKA